jgi:signal peptidase I
MGFRRLKKILHQGLAAVKKHRNLLGDTFEKDLVTLEQLINQKDEAAFEVADRVRQAMNGLPRQSWMNRLFEFTLTLVAAIAIAGVIRQVWFELYEIPTGSMRPTFKEHDRVFVSKTTYGLNLPFATQHLFFSKQRLERGSIVVITVDGLDLPDPDTTYFKFFPGKKRYTKRCAALPGDRVYFYGGDLYCLDKNNTLHQLKKNPLLAQREYLPFISSFEGRVVTAAESPFSRRRTVYLKHINTPIGRVEVSQNGTISSAIPCENSWIPEFSDSNEITRNFPNSFGEFFGIKNFATCRLLLPEALPLQAKRLGYADPKALCWLEMKHSPTLPPSGTTVSASLPLVQLVTTWIPLYEEHCQRLMRNLYTARLLVHEGQLQRYHFEQANFPKVSLPKPIPDGCYEFYFGNAYQISQGSIATKLEPHHPVYPSSIKELVFWFNAGIEPSPEVLSPFSSRMAARFAYWRNQELVIMNTPVFLKGDPILDWFGTQEIQRQARDYTYFSFQDAGAPEANNIEFFNNFGFHVPEGQYLLLGDNPVMSTDSRFFGTVPEENIQGCPLFIFWPFGERWGRPVQPHLFFSIYSIIVTGIVSSILFGISRYQRRQQQAILKNLREKHSQEKN